MPVQCTKGGPLPFCEEKWGRLSQMGWALTNALIREREEGGKSEGCRQRGRKGDAKKETKKRKSKDKKNLPKATIHSSFYEMKPLL